MTDNHSIQQIPSVNVDLSEPEKYPPMVMTASDGKRSITTVYPQAIEQMLKDARTPVLLTKPELPSSRDRRYPDPLMVAIIWFVIALGAAIPLTALALVFEAMNPTVEVQHYGR